MQQASYQELLERSQSVNWRVDDVVGGGARFDFEKPFLPETFVRAGALPFLTETERLKLNHVRSRGYLAMFELVEQFVVPFVSDQATVAPGDDPYRSRALRQFVREENKHRELFRRAEPGAIEQAIDEYFEIGAFFDTGFRSQAELDLAAFERAADRALSPYEREAFARQQHQALRWTFLGSAMRNPNFLAVLGALPGTPRARVESAAGALC